MVIKMSLIIKKSNKLDYIQALRGFAAMAVVICHLRDLFHGTSYALLLIGGCCLGRMALICSL